jgi:hypothetical protein
MQKNSDNQIQGLFFHITESIHHMAFATRYMTHGVIAVAATVGLIIIMVATTNPAVLHHFIIFHQIVSFTQSPLL